MRSGFLVRGSFAALAVRNYAILWTGSLSTFTAFFMSTIVQAIVAFELTGKNGAVGFVLLGQGIAMAVLGPFGGAVADRASKRLVSAIGAAVITAVFVVIGALLAADAIALWHLAAGSFVIGTMFAFMGPARQAWVVDLVEEDLRPNAVALNQVALNAARIWAPAIGGPPLLSRKIVLKLLKLKANEAMSSGASETSSSGSVT